MTVRQRKWHARLWPILVTLVTAGFVIALIFRPSELP